MLTRGQASERRQVPALLEQGVVARPRGRPRHRPQRVSADKGYTGRPVRRYLRRHGIGTVIPRYCSEPRRGVRFDRDAYRQRNVIERTINRLKQFRGIATRYDKLAVRFHASLTIVAILLWV